MKQIIKVNTIVEHELDGIVETITYSSLYGDNLVVIKNKNDVYTGDFKSSFKHFTKQEFNKMWKKRQKEFTFLRSELNAY